MSEDSTLLLVHGAWGGGWIWEPALGPLRERGVRVEVIERLPSAGIDADGLGDLRADAEHVRERLAEIATPVVLCGHSYGGMVITEFADHPAIGHSVYLAAFWPGEGQSLNDLLGGGPLPDWIVDRGDGSFAVTDDVQQLRQALFADLDADPAAQAHEQMVLQSAASFLAPSGAPARSHPTTYVLCTEDQAIPLAAQEAMSAAADHRSGCRARTAPSSRIPTPWPTCWPGWLSAARRAHRRPDHATPPAPVAQAASRRRQGPGFAARAVRHSRRSETRPPSRSSEKSATAARGPDRCLRM